MHPESYPVVERMAKDVGASVTDIMKSKELRQKIVLKNYVSETIGLPTLQDIFQELDKPGRDPRQTFEVFEFADAGKAIQKMADRGAIGKLVVKVAE